MFALRLHTVMGRSAASLWCSSHGPAHCLWSGQAWRDSDDPVDVLSELLDAASEVLQRARQGSLLDLTDECGM